MSPGSGRRWWPRLARGCALSILTVMLLGLTFGVNARAENTQDAADLAILEGMDYHGGDFATLREIGLDQCIDACRKEPRCQAFTFNLAAGWCFLKSDFADPRPYPGAVSGHRIAADTVAAPKGLAALLAPGAEQLAVLNFLPTGDLRRAREQAARWQAATSPTPTEPGGRAALIDAARGALAQGRAEEAMHRFELALRRDASDPELWAEWVGATLASVDALSWSARAERRLEASAGAANAVLVATAPRDRARALNVLANTLAEREEWRPALRALRASLALVEDRAVRDRYDGLRATRGFRVVDHRVETESESPRLCIQFSEPLATTGADLGDFVQIEGHDHLPREVEGQQICVDGVRHGERYAVRVRAGVPAADGETLAEPLDLELYVRDRSPSVRFTGRAYVLPKGAPMAIPFVSVNSDAVAVQIYRIGDRSLAGAVADGTVGEPITDWSRGEIADRRGQALWSGTVEVASTLNREVTTTVPIADLLGELKPGIYAMTARPLGAAEDEWQLPTQWFLVSDLGLATVSANDGLHVLVRSLTAATARAGVNVRLVARNDEILGQAITDDQGYARLAPGLLRGSGGDTPALLVAETEEGDYGFLDLGQSPFDLSDRGVIGRAPPLPLDVYLVSERGAYRPGERVYLTALVRDGQGRAVPEVPLTVIVKRPDGVEYARLLAADRGAGAHRAEIELNAAAMRGTWRARVFTDPEAAPLADLAFLVEDFEPERLDFALNPTPSSLDPRAPGAVSLEARYLFGAPAADLAIEGSLSLKPAATLDRFPGFRFGLASETLEPLGLPLGVARTDDEGKASLPLEWPPLGPTSKPLSAEIQVRVVTEGGRPVERTLSLPVVSTQARIGLRPLFEDAVDEGSTARFETILVAPEGGAVAAAARGLPLRWTLERMVTRWQWYRTDDRWNHEPVTSSQRVADGTLNLVPTDRLDRLDTAAVSGSIEVPVEWGTYRLRVTDPAGNALPVEIDFQAGWAVTPALAETPDLLKVALDRPRYAVGETARVHLEARFPGLATVMVVDDRLIALRALEVAEGGTTLELPVTADWGPGAYITAMLYRPMNQEAGRMPARAIGLSWGEVDPGPRRLAIELRTPPEGVVRPRQRLEIPLRLTGDAASGQTVHVTVAAVDAGILNLTRYQPPAPDDWYFAQRRLGVEIRDLYGRLIDPLGGTLGVIRSGGDGLGLRLQGPPPTEELVAFQSDILTLDDQGEGRVAFDLPDFNGTLRVMAMAWSADGVGHAVTDLRVRDPVVVSATLPRWLAPGDRSRALLELTRVEGDTARTRVRLSTAGSGLGLDPAAAEHELRLGQGERRTLAIPLEGRAVGDDSLRIELSAAEPGSEGEGSQTLTRTLRLSVRTLDPPTLERRVLRLAPGERARLDATSLGLAARVPGTASVLLAASAAGRLDLPGLLAALDRYPHGCAEQLTSRALPLLYLDQVALAAGLADDAAVGERVRLAIRDVLAKQGSDGSFGLWSAGGNDFWLDAYVTDFLTRAREQGYDVPETAFALSLDALRNRLSYLSDFKEGGEAVAYALYVLARNGRAAIGDLRYYADTRLDAFTSGLGRAQLGAALALYGERARADSALRGALDLLDRAGDDQQRWRSDYGSRLRDTAAVLALAAESGSQAVDLAALAERVRTQWDAASWTSTQENAWLLLAAQALLRGPGQAQLEVNGETVSGALFRAFPAQRIEREPLELRNLGEREQDVVVTVMGVPRVAPPAGGQGYRIERAFYDLEGRRADPTRVALGARLIVVLSVTADSPRQARLLIESPLPAGLEIENPHLLRAGETGELRWLGAAGTQLLDEGAHLEFRAERFVAAIDRAAAAPAFFQLAYRVRAVSPGDFQHPAATVEDMYRPELRAWTESGRLEVQAQP